MCRIYFLFITSAASNIGGVVVFRINVHHSFDIGFYACALMAALELISAILAVTWTIFHADLNRVHCSMQRKLPTSKIPVSKLVMTPTALSTPIPRLKPQRSFEIAEKLPKYILLQYNVHIFMCFMSQMFTRIR